MISLENKNQDKTSSRIKRMQLLCINDIYTCNGELLRLLKSKIIEPLVNELSNDKITMDSEFIFKKKTVSHEELFLYNLDKYIGYIKDNYFINHNELIAILPLTIDNKYAKILLSKKQFHSDFNYNIYYDSFRKMFLCNVFNNILYYSSLARNQTSFIELYNNFKHYDLDDNKDALAIEDAMKKIINTRRNNLIDIFVNHEEMPKSEHVDIIGEFNNIIKAGLNNNTFDSIINNDDYFITLNTGSKLVFNIKTNLKKLKENDFIIVEFGIENNNFHSKIKDELFNKKEFYKLLSRLEKIVNDKKYNEVYDFINPTLIFNFWCEEHTQFLDIKFDYGCGLNTESYIISLNEKDTTNLYEMISEQIL